MIQQLLNFIAAVLLCELLVELFQAATPLAPIRRLLGIEDEHGSPVICDEESDKGCAWYSLLAGCPYCLSVWVGVFCAFLFGLRLFTVLWLPVVFDYLFCGLIVHRLSNVWHAVLSRLFDAEGRLRREMEMLAAMEPERAGEEQTDQNASG